MHVRFSDVDEHYIKGKVESGFYTSENEVVRDAVRRMREEEERIARFQASVRIGDEQIERGETVPYSKELMEQRWTLRGTSDTDTVLGREDPQ